MIASFSTGYWYWCAQGRLGEDIHGALLVLWRRTLHALPRSTFGGFVCALLLGLGNVRTRMMANSPCAS